MCWSVPGWIPSLSDAPISANACRCSRSTVRLHSRSSASDWLRWALSPRRICTLCPRTWPMRTSRWLRSGHAGHGTVTHRFPPPRALQSTRDRGTLLPGAHRRVPRDGTCPLCLGRGRLSLWSADVHRWNITAWPHMPSERRATAEVFATSRNHRR
jgi:hypothetical protein